MKYGRFATCIGVALLTSQMAMPRLGLAMEEHGDHHEMAAKPAAAGESLAAVWRDVKTHEAELGQLVGSKKLEQVHEVAFAIRDLVATLPAKSQQLSAEQQTKLNGNVKFVATLAGRLDASGDANDQAATEAGFKQLQSVLASIEGIYPAEALK